MEYRFRNHPFNLSAFAKNFPVGKFDVALSTGEPWGECLHTWEMLVGLRYVDGMVAIPPPKERDCILATVFEFETVTNVPKDEKSWKTCISEIQAFNGVGGETLPYILLHYEGEGGLYVFATLLLDPDLKYVPMRNFNLNTKVYREHGSRRLTITSNF